MTEDRFEIFFQLRSLISFGKESSPSLMRAKKPVRSMHLNSLSSWDCESVIFSRTWERSGRVRARFLFVGEL